MLRAVALAGMALVLAIACGGDGSSPTDSPTLSPSPSVGELSPTPRASTGKIAFVSNRDGNSEVYVMNADGSGPTNLTNNPAYDSFPAWSPDGTRIAFFSGRDGGGIYVMNADGSGVTRLSQAWPLRPVPVREGTGHV